MEKKIYKLLEFQNNQEIQNKISEIKKIWDELTNKEIEKWGADKAHMTCTLGAHFFVNMIMPRKRKAQPYEILQAPTYEARFYYDTKDIILKLLRDAGIDAYWNCGSLD